MLAEKPCICFIHRLFIVKVKCLNLHRLDSSFRAQVMRWPVHAEQAWQGLRAAKQETATKPEELHVSCSAASCVKLAISLMRLFLHSNIFQLFDFVFRCPPNVSPTVVPTVQLAIQPAVQPCNACKLYKLTCSHATS